MGIITKSRVVTVFILVVVSFNSPPSFADNRIWLQDTTIDGKSVKLCLDSGSNFNLISLDAVERLGLKFGANQTNDGFAGFFAGVIDHCTLAINGYRAQTGFRVVKFPDYVGADFDGLIGWYPGQNVVLIDAATRQAELYSKMPRRARNWIHFSVNTNFGTLELEVPHGGSVSRILSIDTGTDSGLELPSNDWNRWKKSHPHSPTTLKTFYTPTEGFVIREEA
jgi:hypothetical protein